nr:hypothetical protein [Tanacetum cinerariifolium]
MKNAKQIRLNQYSQQQQQQPYQSTGSQPQSDHQSYNLIDETEDKNEEEPIPTPMSKKTSYGSRLKAKAKKTIDTESQVKIKKRVDPRRGVAFDGNFHSNFRGSKNGSRFHVTDEEPEHFRDDVLPQLPGLQRIAKSQSSGSNSTASSGSNPMMYQEFMKEQYELDRKVKMQFLVPFSILLTWHHFLRIFKNGMSLTARPFPALCCGVLARIAMSVFVVEYSLDPFRVEEQKATSSAGVKNVNCPSAVRYSLGEIKLKFYMVCNAMRLSFLSYTEVDSCTDFNGSVHGVVRRPFKSITNLEKKEDVMLLVKLLRVGILAIMIKMEQSHSLMMREMRLNAGCGAIMPSNLMTLNSCDDHGRIFLVLQFAMMKFWDGKMCIQNGYWVPKFYLFDGNKAICEDEYKEVEEFRQRLFANQPSEQSENTAMKVSTASENSTKDNFVNQHPIRNIAELLDAEQ